MAQTFLRNRKFLGASVALVIVVLVAGCGGGGGSASAGDAESRTPTVQANSLSTKAFLKKANALCKQTKTRSQIGYVHYAEAHKVPSSGSGLTAKAAEFVTTVFTPIYQDQIDKLRALGAPRGDEAKITSIIEAMERGLAQSKAHPLGFIRSAPFFSEASKLSIAYGLGECSA